MLKCFTIIAGVMWRLIFSANFSSCPHQYWSTIHKHVTCYVTSHVPFVTCHACVATRCHVAREKSRVSYCCWNMIRTWRIVKTGLRYKAVCTTPSILARRCHSFLCPVILSDFTEISYFLFLLPQEITTIQWRTYLVGLSWCVNLNEGYLF